MAVESFEALCGTVKVLQGDQIDYQPTIGLESSQNQID